MLDLSDEFPLEALTCDFVSPFARQFK